MTAKTNAESTPAGTVPPLAEPAAAGAVVELTLTECPPNPARVATAPRRAAPGPNTGVSIADLAETWMPDALTRSPFGRR